MEQNELKKIVISKIYQITETGYLENEITGDMTLNNDLGLDSLDNVELIMDLEKTLRIGIPDDDGSGTSPQVSWSVQQLIDHVSYIVSENSK